MKKMYKAMLLALCAVLLVAGSVMGTLAYLQDKTETVTNTFAVGKVKITLDEAKTDIYGNPVDPAVRIPNADETDVTGNVYKLIPNHSYKKDPTVYVEANSEACYVFVKVVNGIAAIEDSANTIANQITNKGWTELENVDNVYYIAVNADDAKNGKRLPVFESFKISSTATNDSLSTYNEAKITVNAYAIQSDGFSSAKEAWTAANFS